MICGFQIKFQIGSKVGKSFDILLKLALLPGIDLGIIRHGNLAEQSFHQISVFLLERQREQAAIPFHQLRGHNHIIIILSLIHI